MIFINIKTRFKLLHVLLDSHKVSDPQEKFTDSSMFLVPHQISDPSKIWNPHEKFIVPLDPCDPYSF